MLNLHEVHKHFLSVRISKEKSSKKIGIVHKYAEREHFFFLTLLTTQMLGFLFIEGI